MRLSLILLFILAIAVSIQAQDTVRMPDDLPEPIFQDDLLGRVDAQQVAWLDNETVLVAPLTTQTYSEQVVLETAFQYNVSTGELIDLEFTPFVSAMPSDLREWYRVRDEDHVLQSPYTFGDGETHHHILYRSDVDVFGAVTYPITMHGAYAPDLTIPSPEGMASHSRFEPTDLFLTDGMRVLWSRNKLYAFVELSGDFGGGRPLTWLDLETGNDIGIGVYYADVVYDRVLTMSDDGQRIIFATGMPETPDSSDGNQKLLVWDAPYYDEFCGCTYDEQLTFINPEPLNESAFNRFVGASFVDEDTMLYIGEIGLMRHNLLTGISTLIDPNYNSAWITNAYFSPDNQHVLIVAGREIYVISLF